MSKEDLGPSKTTPSDLTRTTGENGGLVQVQPLTSAVPAIENIKAREEKLLGPEPFKDEYVRDGTDTGDEDLLDEYLRPAREEAVDDGIDEEYSLLARAEDEIARGTTVKSDLYREMDRVRAYEDAPDTFYLYLRERESFGSMDWDFHWCAREPFECANVRDHVDDNTRNDFGDVILATAVLE